MPGGGGDCFFLSVASILLYAAGEQEDLARNLSTRCPTLGKIQETSRRPLACRLRMVVSTAVRGWPWKRFLDYVVACLQQEAAGQWRDGWRMSSLVKDTAFAFLKATNNLELVFLEGQDFSVWHRVLDDPEVICETVHLALPDAEQLRKRVCVYLETPGNMHWADQTDIAVLQEELNVGWCLFGDRAQTADGCVLHRVMPTSSTPDTWLCLRYMQEVHFQVLFLKWQENRK